MRRRAEQGGSGGLSLGAKYGVGNLVGIVSVARTEPWPLPRAFFRRLGDFQEIDMSHETPEKPARPTPIRTKGSSGGGKWKWAAGAVAAVAVVGAGLYAWSNADRGQPSDEFAYNESTPAEAFDAASLDSAPNAAPEPEAIAEPAAVTSERSSRTSSRTRDRQVASNDDVVVEQVVGVSPDGVTTYEDSEDVIVQGRRTPEWTRTPSAYRLSTAYPERALERGREGEARVHCTVLENGALDCVRASETGNSGFGLAALRVARMFRHAPERADGSSAVGTPVNLRVVFRLEDERRG